MSPEQETRHSLLEKQLIKTWDGDRAGDGNMDSALCDHLSRGNPFFKSTHIKLQHFENNMKYKIGASIYLKRNNFCPEAWYWYQLLHPPSPSLCLLSCWPVIILLSSRPTRIAWHCLQSWQGLRDRARPALGSQTQQGSRKKSATSLACTPAQPRTAAWHRDLGQSQRQISNGKLISFDTTLFDIIKWWLLFISVNITRSQWPSSRVSIAHHNVSVARCRHWVVSPSVTGIWHSRR